MVRRSWRACCRIRARLFEWGLVQWYALVMVGGLVGICFLLRVSVEQLPAV